ncbi:hypothetical protein DFH07DRAFT_901039 [Mycena maculata]|uniref:Fruit-body specific protein a n=1 Tax=Mycena maculata TaxID=230809 RepID=A0AAD7KBG4_9AGAR|nr:hypothetical protein DFH07DRAFT_901039 [Mycena maculata]
MLFRRILVLVAALCASAQYTLPPASQAAQDSASGTSDLPSNSTDTASIVQTAQMVNQKSGATDGTPPDLPQDPTQVTAVDGLIMVSNISNSNSTDVPVHRAGKRAPSDYALVFNGNNTYDAAVQGTAYLTYTLVSNASYAEGLAESFTFCDNTPGCVFFNLFYEFNNKYLDSQNSNLKCVAFGDFHSAAEKVAPIAPTVIQNSTGYASLAQTSADVQVVEGYELVFGPISAANNAPGYMGFAFLSKYDPSACAELCNQRGPDAVGGACKYFNIWRALVDGCPTTYTCAMYSAPTNVSTATNTGQGTLSVTLSRGYARQSHIPDGDFEAYICDPPQQTFCFAEKAPGWIGTSPTGGQFDATIFHYAPYSHGGTGVGLLGCAFGSDPQPGTLTPAAPLSGLLPGRAYVVQFFHSSTYSGVQLEAPAFVNVLWNGALVGSVNVGYSPWTFWEFPVTAVGNDTLQFTGGKAPAYDFIDDVYLFLA